MILMCTLNQPQVASWKHAGYHKAKYHGSKVEKNTITVALNVFQYAVMCEKTLNEQCKWTT